jgi:Uma2 family endonuclease
MAQVSIPPRAKPQARTYLRPPRAIHFAEHEEIPEGFAYLVVRTFLFRLLSFALGPEHSVGSEQFVYWRASDPRRKLAPDVFVRLGVAQRAFGSWKTWAQGGAPDLAVEIVSPNEGDGISWDDKLERYHELGVRELVRFDPEEAAGARLRVWDRVQDDLVERRVEGDQAACDTLGLCWVVCMIPMPSGRDRLLGLRLVDGEGHVLEAPEEAEASARRAEAQAHAAEADAVAAEKHARVAAEQRVRELEEELRRRGG